MNDHIALIRKKLEHLDRMRSYLQYSVDQVHLFMPIHHWALLTPEQHESLAALRVRFSEYQEHIGKTMKAVAQEEEKPVEPFTSVLVYMEKLNCIDSVQRWKEIRELRNAVNHEYEEDSLILGQFFEALLKSAPELFEWHDNLRAFCRRTYLVD